MEKKMAKILLVDDSETLRTQVVKLLTSKGHSVVESVDGIKGLEALNGNKDIKLIICDVNMPNMDGLTMCSRVAADPNMSRIPIFMLTTEASPDLKEKGKAAGVKAWLLKPYIEEKLIAVVERILAA
jgi:two-component system chemotaxis response regulator CheY